MKLETYKKLYEKVDNKFIIILFVYFASVDGERRVFSRFCPWIHEKASYEPQITYSKNKAFPFIKIRYSFNSYRNCIARTWRLN